jgi:hypothetical protein
VGSAGAWAPRKRRPTVLDALLGERGAVTHDTPIRPELKKISNKIADLRGGGRGGREDGRVLAVDAARLA